MVFVREVILTKLLAIQELPTEGVYTELTLRQKKWHLCCSYYPNQKNFKTFTCVKM